MSDVTREQDERDAAYLANAPNNDASPILHQFHSWAVTEYGIEHLGDAYYPIEKDRVHESDWARHMADKGWVRMRDFLAALDHARSIWPEKRMRTADGRLAPRTPTATAPARRSVSPRMRFAVLRRDTYACQLCGATAADGVVLEIDHQIPISKGGTNDEANLWTLCRDCNQGKSDALA
jgi:5-methylcytosine-specific restriction endonuclease McrA